MKEKFIISLLSQVFSYVISLFAFYLIILNLDTITIGIWTLVNSVVNLGFLFINIGLDSIHYQYTSKENSSEYFGTFFTIKLVLLLINVLIAILLTYFISLTELWNSDFFFIVLFLLFSRILFNVANIFSINLKSKIKVFKAEIPAFFITFGKSLSIIILALNLQYFSNPLLFISISNFIFDLLFLGLILLFSKNEYKLYKPRKDIVLLYLKDIKPLFFFSITLVVAANLGNLILDYSFGHASLGNFSFINNYIIQTLLVISTSLIIVYLTLFSKYFEKGDLNSIKKITYVIEKYSSIIFLWIIIVVLLNGKLMLTIFLPQYVETASVLYIMVFVPYFIAITQPYSYQFIAGKNQKINAYINSLTRILIIVLMIFLIPTRFFIIQTLGMGEIGYAISQTLPWIIWVFANRYYSYTLYNIIPQKNIILHALLAFASLVISFFIKSLILETASLNQALLLIISSLISLGLFFGLLITFRELKREDLRFILQLVKFKSYRDSLKGEFLK